MASFLTDLAKPYVEKLINGAIAESSYICCFTCIAMDFEEERARLEIERYTVKERVDLAIRRGDDVQVNVRSWEKDADELIQEDTKTKQKCLFGFCPHCIWRYRRAKKLTNKKEQIKRLIVTRTELSIGLPARLPDVERYSSGHYISFESRESKYIELLDALKDDSNYVIGLKGMGGTGKTTLAKEVGKELKKSNHFTNVIDTTVSLSPDIRKIQDDIAGPLGLKFDECSESDRPKKLWSRLTNGDKILLILDDVWGDIDFNEIGIPYSDNRNGCTILVTTRNMFVCNRLGCSKTIQLDLLSEDDAWNMFQRHAGLSKTSTKNLREKGRKVANECKRLPIAIAAIASSLKGEHRQEEWDVALTSLQKHMPMHGVDDDLITIYKCLQLSYENMKNEKAQRLFLLCCIFREDEKIPIKRLTRLGIGGGLFGEDYVNYEDARSQVVRSKNKLLDSCLLLEDDQSTVKMHDLVRDVAQWIANKEIQRVQLYGKNQKAMVERETNIKYLLCEGNLKDVFSFKLDGSKLEILIVIVHEDEDCHDVKIEVPNSFFENSTSVRVFHLIYGHLSKLDLSLPLSIQSLKNIRSLLFTRVDLGDISIFENLESLETLDLDHCKIDELPHGITKLEKFRLLNLNMCYIARNNPFEVIEGCSRLEELYFIRSFNDSCREITFPKLQRFYIADRRSEVDESSSKCVSFVLKEEVFLSETTLKYCMQEAKVLRLRRIEGGWRNIIPEIVPLDHGMNDLLELSLYCISQLQCLIDTKHIDSQVLNVFSKLVVLELSKLENLEELCNGPYSFDFLNNLEKLSINDCKHLQSLFKCNLNLSNLKSLSLIQCPMLTSLFQLSTAVSLVLLERLEIYNCGCLEYIIDERKGEELRGEIVDDNNNTSHGSIFQKLKVLSIQKCPRFEVILPFLSAHDLPALESITIKSCDKLKYIFGQDVKLCSLIKMELDSIPNFIGIFPECNRTMSLSIKKPYSISGDASEPQEQSDPIKCNIFSWTDIYCYGKKHGHKLRSTTSTNIPLVSQDQPQDNLMESNSYCLRIWERAPQCLSRQPHILCNIKEITLRNISKMKSIFILSIAPRMLLETLTLWNCDELKHIIIDIDDHDNGGNNLCNVFPKLKELSVDYCVQLEYIIGHYNGDHQNDNEIHLHLPALERLMLSRLPSLISISPKQYHTTFPRLKELDLNQCSQVANVKSIGEIMKESNSYCLRIWERDPQCLSRQLHILCNIKEITLSNISKMKSIFILSIAPRMLLETLKIWNCDELKHVIIDIDDHDNSGNNLCNVFPKLKELYVDDCVQLEYIIGHYNGDHQNDNEIHLHLPALERLILEDLPSLIGMCPKQYHTTFSPLKELNLNQCSLVANFKSIGEIMKELSRDVDHFLTLKRLVVNNNSKVENIVCLNEINEQQMNLGLESIDLDVLPMMTCLFVGPKNLFSLQNLTELKIVRCEKLKIVFSTSIVRCLPQLRSMIIEECKELKHIIEDDLENKNSSNFMSTKICFPKLQSLVVVKCNKLKYVFRIKKFPELKGLMIREADELEEIFVSEGDDQKVEIPNLQYVVFENLPSLCHAQEIQFQAVKYRFIQNCQKLSVALPSTADLKIIKQKILCSDFYYGFQFYYYLNTLFEQLQKETSKDFADRVEVKASSEHELTSPKKKLKQRSEIDHEFVENVPGLEIPSIALLQTNPEELMNQKSMDQQRLLGETDTAVKPSHINHLEGSTTSEKNIAEMLSTISVTKNEPPIQLVALNQKVSEISVEDGITSANAKTITYSHEYDDDQIAIPIAITKPLTTQDVDINTNDDQVSLHDDAVIKVTSTVEEQFSKDVELKVPESKPSPIIPSPQAFQTPSMLSGGDLSQIDQELEDGDGQIAMTSFSIATTKTNNQVSRNDDAFKKVSSNIKERLPKDDNIIVLKSQPSHVASQFPTVPSKEDPSQKVEDFSSSLLVSKKHLDYENTSLLTDFLVKHPSVLLKDTSLSNRYKDYAYNCLAELLKFLQTHSVLDVLGSSHSEFVELLQDVRKCGFDKDWLDGVEKRALFPGLQVSQDALQKLLDSKHILTQHVEDLKHQLASSEAVLESIIQQEAQILETQASLSDPIGY